MRISILAALLGLLLAGPANAATEWRIETSAKYDALCLTGVLADDPFYTRYYEVELEALRAGCRQRPSRRPLACIAHSKTRVCSEVPGWPSPIPSFRPIRWMPPFQEPGIRKTCVAA
jgi:hypothetical protein